MTPPSSEPADITAQQALLSQQCSNALQPAVQGSNFTAQPLQLSLPDQVAIRPQLQMIQCRVPAVREMLQQPLAPQGALRMQQIHSAVMQTPAVPLELYSIQQQLAQHHVLAQQPQSAVPNMLFSIQQHLGQQHLVQQLLMQQVSAMQRPALQQLDQQQLPLQQVSTRQHAPAVAPNASRRQQVVQRVPPVLPGTVYNICLQTNCLSICLTDDVVCRQGPEPFLAGEAFHLCSHL